MQKLAVLLEKLNIAQAKDKIVRKEGEELINVNVMTSAIAFIYEKVRTIVDYNEEHLLRKSAIFRILKRRFLESDDYYKIGENLIKELISARYLDNNKLPETKIIEVAKSIEKYDLLYQGVKEQKGRKIAANNFLWILNIAAVEIEEILVPANKEKVYIRFMYDEMMERLEIVSKGMSEEEKKLQIFIAVNRSLIKSDRTMLEYFIIKLWYPEWKNNYQLVLPKFIDEIISIREDLNKQINHKMANRLLKVCRRYAMMTLVLRQVIQKNPDSISALVGDVQILENEIRDVCQKKYSETRSRLKTQIGRAIVYVFLTKMLLALILEVPFDYYILHSFNWLALFVNITFPPLLMVLIATTIRTPSDKNTKTMIVGINDILRSNIPEIQYVKEPRKRFWFTWVLFNLIYIVTFLIPFALIIYCLNKIHLSVVSIALFLVFLSIVSYFGLRIRNLARELIVLKKRENILGELFDFMTLPFVRLGRFLSLNFSKINVFVFFLDFIIEAPLKIILQAIEEWLAFFKEKKEELDQQ